MDPVRTASRDVAHALARCCRKFEHLEHLSAAFLVDATDFLPAMLDPRSTKARWCRLASLTLTSRQLTPGRAAEDINELFVWGARAAGWLPQLRVLELWNGGRGVASVFRYRAQNGVPAAAGEPARASILWRATFRVALEDRVVRAWKRVASAWRPCELLVVVEELDSALVRSHGDAIPLLGFEHDVVEPVSLEQIQWENRF